jgi:hypothetical protein
MLMERDTEASQGCVPRLGGVGAKGDRVPCPSVGSWMERNKARAVTSNLEHPQ